MIAVLYNPFVLSHLRIHAWIIHKRRLNLTLAVARVILANMRKRNRYRAQEKSLGVDSSQRLKKSSVLIIGCGGLGCVLADLLTRAGVGRLLIVDDDKVTEENLHRQLLFDEISVGNLKVMAAEDRLRTTNKSVLVEPITARFTRENAERLLYRIDLVLDATDNLETRLLIDEICYKRVPWIYAGVGDRGGIVMPVPRGEKFLLPPPSERNQKGVVGPIVYTIASLQAYMALQILNGEVPSWTFIHIDARMGRFMAGRDRLSEAVSSQNQLPSP